MTNVYLFFDGSALLADIKRQRSAEARFSSKRLDLAKLVQYFAGPELQHFHGGGYRRAVFYFVQKDERLSSMVEMPDCTQPGAVNDLRLEFCGRRIRAAGKLEAWLAVGEGCIQLGSIRDGIFW